MSDLPAHIFMALYIVTHASSTCIPGMVCSDYSVYASLAFYIIACIPTVYGSHVPRLAQ